MHGDTAVVTRDKVDVRFYSTTNSSFELVTRIDIDFVVAVVVVSGDTAVVGSYADETGVVYVHERDPRGGWSQALRITSADLGTVHFGWVLALDGDVMVLGALNTAYVYRRSQSTWVQEATLSAPDGFPVDTFHNLKVKGNSIVAAAPAYRNDTGIVFVYGWDPASNAWTPVGVPLVHEDCPGRFGEIIELLDDGQLMVLCQRSFWATDPVVLYYYAKEEMHGAYALQQSLDFDGPLWSFDTDDDAMVLTEYQPYRQEFVARFLARRNHTWEEVTALYELPGFPRYGYGYRVRLSGSSVLFASYVNASPADRVEMGW